MPLSRRTCRLLLALILIVSVGCCVWFSLPLPNPQRWYDERFSMNNVQHLLNTDSWYPRTKWYPALSHLPLAAIAKVVHWLHETTGIESLRVLTHNGYIAPTGYFLGRWLSTVFGAATILMTFRVGRHAFSRGVGLLGALFLAVSPSFFRLSTVFKPDTLMVFLTMVGWSRGLRRFS